MIKIEVEECNPLWKPSCPFYHNHGNSYYTEWCNHPLEIKNRQDDKSDYLKRSLPEICPLKDNPVTICKKE